MRDPTNLVPMAARLIAIALLLCAMVPDAQAARTFVSGWDTCDELEFDDGGTTANTLVSSTGKRTGRCALQVAPADGGGAYHERDLSPADIDVYARVAVRPTVAATTGKVFFGFWQSSTSSYGCRADLESDGAISVRYKNRNVSYEIGTTEAAQLPTGAYHSVELHQKNISAEPCSGDCQVRCELWFDGTQILAATLTNVAGADYDPVTNVRLGAAGTDPGAYTMIYDDVALDDNVQIGVGRSMPLAPTANGTNVAWGNGGNVGDCGAGASKYGCVNDYASGTSAHDVDDSYLEASGNGDRQDMELQDISPSLVSGETVSTVTVLAVGREQTSGTRNFRVNLWNGTTAITRTTFETDNSLAYLIYNSTSNTTRNISAVKPGGGAWTEATVNSLQAQLEKTSSQTNRVTAVLAYVEVTEQPPAIAQNLQDWNGDGFITIATLVDSITRGTGTGLCQGDTTKTCTVNSDCIPEASGGTCQQGCVTNVGPCSNTAKYPTILGSSITQKMTGATTVLNCGINGNETQDLMARMPTIFSGVGLVSTYYCRNHMPRPCTPIGGCDASDCRSSDCEPQGTLAPTCGQSCSLVLGTALCSGNHTTVCTSNADCTGNGTCTDYPGADYLTVLTGANDAHVSDDPNCFIAANINTAIREPCPPQHTVHPNATPTPGAPYKCERVSCNSDAECRTGLCSNDFSKACDINGDCSGGGTCNTSLALGAFETCNGTCSNDSARLCSSNVHCNNSGTCNLSSKACSCSCLRIPCATDADCGGSQRIFGAAEHDKGLRITGTCSGGLCTQCGPPGCSGDKNYDALQAVAGGYPGGASRQSAEEMEVLTAAAGRRLIWLTHTLIPTSCSIFGWGGSLGSLRSFRQYLLGKANAVDLWLAQQFADQMLYPKRCSTDTDRACVANADCGSGTCQTYVSTMHPPEDEVHPSRIGGETMAAPVAAYLEKLSPVCSGDLTTGCGRCSITTSTACLTSADCPAFSAGVEKCVKTDSVCSGAGKGTCSRERACNSASSCVTHSLCTLDLTTRCTTDGDCTTGKGVCRPEGLLAAGEG